MLEAIKRLAFRPKRPDEGIDTTIIFAISILLIFNSHLEQFWPNPIFAADGFLGNSLFYFLSGYAIQHNIIHKPQSFSPFTLSRFTRIYPSLIIIVAAFSVVGIIEIQWGSFKIIVETLLWPTSYTYLRHIMIFYVLIFICYSLKRGSLHASLFLAAAVFIALYFEQFQALSLTKQLSLGQLDTNMWSAFFWLVCGSGALLARGGYTASFTGLRILAIGGSLLLYFALKALMVTGYLGPVWFPTIFLIILILCPLITLCLGSPRLASRLSQVGWLWIPTCFLANLTLQIYLVHDPLSRIESIYKLFWPLNIIVLLLISTLVAVPTFLISSWISRRITTWPMKKETE